MPPTVERVHRAILDLIREGNLGPGERLPNEREMSRRFRTGRSVVRGALSMAESQGLIMRRVGSGTYLSDRAPTIIEGMDADLELNRNAPASLHETLEARMTFEPGVTALAAERANEVDLAHLNELLKSVETAASWLKFKEAIYAFQSFVYELSGNSFLVATFDRIVDERRRVDFNGRAVDTQVSGLVRVQAAKDLSLIAEAIGARDRALAEQRSREYLLRLVTGISM
jgi:DNA-binding FadR family transcriptional regulator